MIMVGLVGTLHHHSVALPWITFLYCLTLNSSQFCWFRSGIQFSALNPPHSYILCCLASWATEIIKPPADPPLKGCRQRFQSMSAIAYLSPHPIKYFYILLTYFKIHRIFKRFRLSMIFYRHQIFSRQLSSDHTSAY